PSMLSSRMIFGLDGSRMIHPAGTDKSNAANLGGCDNMAIFGSPVCRGTTNGGRTGTEMEVPQHAMKVEKGVTVTMRDGIKISLCVYRPNEPGQYPTLFR